MYINIPFHGLMEGLGSGLAFSVALFLLTLLRYRRVWDNSIWLACGLMVLAVLDGFHALCEKIDDYVVLMRSSAALGSAAFFVLSWLPERIAGRAGSRVLFLGMIVLSLLFGAAFLVFPSAVPAMVRPNGFTTTTMAINLAAGGLYLSAALRFFIFYRSRRTEISDILFIIFFAVLGFSAIWHPFSAAWTWQWWGWHTARLFGYIVIGMYLFTKYFYLLEDIRRTNRALKTLGECNQILVRAEDEQKFISDVCRIIVEFGGYRMAWFGYAQDDEAKTVKPVASAGYEDGYLEKLNVSWADNERGQGPTGRAIRTGKPCIARDIRNDPNFSPWRIEAVRRGYASSISLPLVSGGRCFGALNIYGSEPDAFDADEVRLLEELALDLAYGITTLRGRQAKRQAEDRYRNTLDNMLEGCQIIGFDWRYLYLNDAAVRHGKKTRDELLGRTMMECYPGIEKTGMFAALERCMKERIPHRMGNEFNYPDGSKSYFELSIHPVPEGVFILSMDISDLKKAETQLLQAQKLESVGTLAGGIAHDFNNIIGAVKGFAELAIMDTDKSSPIHEYLRYIVSSTDRAANLTRQLLIFSRTHSAELRTLNLNETVNNILKMLKRLIGEDIAIETNLEPGLAFVKADAGNIEQVLMNLAINSRDAMPKGGTITIKTENVVIDEKYRQLNIESRCGNFACLTVSDTGSGMSKDVLSRIFEPFFTTKAQGKGTGLGLSVVYGIVKKHNGWVNVYSEVGQGSVFKIYLPAAAEKTAAKTETRIIPPEQLKGKGERLLVVEDDEGIRKLVSRALENMNYQVLIASSGAEARKIFEQETAGVHLIISDVVLPDINGIELCDELTRAKPEVHVLLSSGDTSRSEYGDRIQERNIPFIPKPYKLSDLFKTIREILESRGVGD
ncbi:MAG: GAF domain-containing protein [Planctomycetota bacterium]